MNDLKCENRSLILILHRRCNNQRKLSIECSIYVCSIQYPSIIIYWRVKPIKSNVMPFNHSISKDLFVDQFTVLVMQSFQLSAFSIGSTQLTTQLFFYNCCLSFETRDGRKSCSGIENCDKYLSCWASTLVVILSV